MKVIHYFLHFIAGMEKGGVIPPEDSGHGHPAYQRRVAVFVGQVDRNMSGINQALEPGWAL